MKLLNVGALEFVLILLLALIVLGPRKAVKTAGEVGRWIKNLFKSEFWQELQKTSREIQDLPKKMMDEAEIQKTIKELDRSEAALKRGIGRDDPSDGTNEWEDPHHIHPELPRIQQPSYPHRHVIRRRSVAGQPGVNWNRDRARLR